MAWYVRSKSTYCVLWEGRLPGSWSPHLSQVRPLGDPPTSEICAALSASPATKGASRNSKWTRLLSALRSEPARMRNDCGGAGRRGAPRGGREGGLVSRGCGSGGAWQGAARG